MAASTGGSSSGGSDDDGMAVLGKLICDMNPYTEMPKYEMSGALKTGKMNVYTGNAVPAEFHLQRNHRTNRSRSRCGLPRTMGF